MKNIKILFVFSIFLYSNCLLAQDQVFLMVEEQPEFTGGNKAFAKYLRKNLKYPKKARRMGIEGKVFVEFVVNKDGSLADIEIIKGIGGGCDEEAVRVLKNSPKWIPGKQRGKSVRVKMSVPIVFRLTGGNEKQAKEKASFTKYVMFDEQKIKEEDIKDKVNSPKNFAYMCMTKDNQLASKLYGETIKDGEGLTLFYTQEFGKLNKVLKKYGINIKTKEEEKRIKVSLSYQSQRESKVLFVTSKLVGEDMKPIDVITDKMLTIGKNKFSFEIDLEDNIQEYFLSIIEPISNTDFEPKTMHIIKLQNN